MKMSDYVELYKMIDLLANGGEKIKDFGINDDGAGEIWVTLENGEIFDFFPNK